MTPGALIWITVFVLGVIVFFVYARMRRFFRCLFFTAFTGLGSLGLLWVLGRFFVIAVSITPLTIAVAGLLGVPGVVSMLLLYLI